jgi:sugar lactone lactonase YvrE
VSARRTVVLDDGYEYEVVDQRDRNQRRPLAIILALLILLLIGLAYLAFSLSKLNGGAGNDRGLEGLRWIRSIYGYGPQPAQQLRRPTDTAIETDGSIWVADGQNSRLLRFAPDGGFISGINLVRGLKARQVAALEAIDVDAQGTLYITDGVRNRVLKLRPDGTILTEWPIPFPGDVVVGSDRVVVTGPSGIAVFDTAGKQIALIGTTRGKSSALFDIPRGTAIGEDGTIYVSDTQNKRVKAYDKNGELLWISKGLHKDVIDEKTGDVKETVPVSSKVHGTRHAMQLPVGLVLDGSGRLVVVDPFEFGLWVLDPKKHGQLVAHYGQPGERDGLFIYPTRMDYDPARDWFAVADTNNDRVQIVSIPGSGGSLGTRLRRILDFPWWICCLPLIALVIAALLIATAKRRARDADSADAAEQLEGVGATPGVSDPAIQAEPDSTE